MTGILGGEGRCHALCSGFGSWLLKHGYLVGCTFMTPASVFYFKRNLGKSRQDHPVASNTEMSREPRPSKEGNPSLWPRVRQCWSTEEDFVPEGRVTSRFRQPLPRLLLGEGFQGVRGDATSRLQPGRFPLCLWERTVVFTRCPAPPRTETCRQCRYHTRHLATHVTFNLQQNLCRTHRREKGRAPLPTAFGERMCS